ncbi:MAG: hypothetical protein IJX03_05195 [Clostridia bacterium]|nr:hypothetical protein [Clostridia bacterium]
MSKLFKNDWFKCITVLLLLAVILGGALAVLNDVLYVSSEERTARAIKKIYGTEKEYSITLDVDRGDTAISNEYGTIEKIYNVGNDLLFKSTGGNGYKNGTITLWLKVVKENGNYVIDKVVLDGYEKQTLMSKFSQSYYDKFLIDVTDSWNNGSGIFLFSPKDEADKLQNPNTGATKSANAACNAVNAVILYLVGGNA